MFIQLNYLDLSDLVMWFDQLSNGSINDPQTSTFTNSMNQSVFKFSTKTTILKLLLTQQQQQINEIIKHLISTTTSTTRTLRLFT